MFDSRLGNRSGSSLCENIHRFIFIKLEVLSETMRKFLELFYMLVCYSVYYEQTSIFQTLSILIIP